MKKTMLLSALALTLSMTASAQGKAHLSGTITGAGDNDVILIQFVDEGRQSDTLRIGKEGRYDQQVEVKQPNVAYLFVDNLKLTDLIFVEDGMNATYDVTISRNKADKENPYSLTATYGGDDKDCYDYIKANDVMSEYNRWPWPRINAYTSFRDFRSDYLAYTDSLKAECNKVGSLAFRRMTLEKIDQGLASSIARYAWRDKGCDDADLTRWMLSFDHNDPKSGFADTYFRWYQTQHKGSSYFRQIKEAFDNQDIINGMADDLIVQFLQSAPDDMDQLMADYKAVSTNAVGIAKAEQVYNHYKKMKKGMPAVDFTFSDAKGKVYHLSDFRGKALYIDVWATWCGPCCMEIPYMEKLAAKYKGDKRINMISISFDDNRAKWDKKLAADKPKWPQFICPENFQSKLCREYDIHGIPRFMMFDKDGNIVSLDAPRPSDEHIVDFIENALK